MAWQGHRRTGSWSVLPFPVQLPYDLRIIVPKDVRAGMILDFKLFSDPISTVSAATWNKIVTWMERVGRSQFQGIVQTEDIEKNLLLS
jgi:hypothetical protein